MAQTGVFRDIHLAIESDPDNHHVAGIHEVLRRVKREKFAFIDDVTFFKYYTSDDCSLAIIPEKFYPTGFGLAVPEDWPYIQYFDTV